MANRVYFANQQVAFKPIKANGDGLGGGSDGRYWITAAGVQSVAVTTTFNLEQAFELGQLSIYENIEGVPDVEVTCSKVLDGYPLLYHLATSNPWSEVDKSPTLAGRSNSACVVGLGIWPDTVDSATGNPQQQMEASGMFASSVSYSFPLEDNFTEDITLVGNNKGWKAEGGRSIITARGCTTPGWVFAENTGSFDGNHAPVGTGGINRREDIAFNATDASDAGGENYTQLPTDIPGVSANGWMNPRHADNFAHLQSISVSTDLGREELFELGTKQPYARVVTFPVEVTCDIEVLSLSGDLINAFADGCTTATTSCAGTSDNLSNQKIRIATCEGTRIYLGAKNKLASVNYGGGDAGGGNVTVTYSYTTFNDFTVMHVNDTDVSGSQWWKYRSTYLK